MKPTGTFIARTARFFSAIALVGLLASCTAPMAGRQDLNDAQSKASGQPDADPGDSSELPPDERPFWPSLQGWLQAGESKTPMSNKHHDHFNLN